MESLLGHITTFSIIFPLAIQRLWLSLSLQAQSTPSDPFKPKPWHFSTSDHHTLRRNATIYLSLLLLLPITIFASLHPISARHVASLLLFSLLLALILLADSHRVLLLPRGALFFLSAFVFLADSALSNPNSTTHFSEVGFHLRSLTMGPTLICAISCFVLAFVSSNAADVALSIALALKGSWELQVGLTFYVLKLRGCSTAGGPGGVSCELHEDATRAMHMLDLLFSSHAVAIATVCLGMQWIAARWVNRTAETDAMLTRLVEISTSDLEFD
ncbi:hypothetical protein LUZ61_018590 [Rhynchospora tenuis]|uniref:Uncharacterized protein n=1 Tax=Rhynchospora tenuis TaxID=198213 RepID=A0AAD5Z9Q0_9POAL|nr:hypothetical protein LUZ61_018590 [Rhynchospora tenuis]